MFDNFYIGPHLILSEHSNEDIVCKDMIEQWLYPLVRFTKGEVYEEGVRRVDKDMPGKVACVIIFAGFNKTYDA